MADEQDELGTHVDDVAAEAVTEPEVPQAPVEKAIADEDADPKDAQDDQGDKGDEAVWVDDPEPLQDGIVLETE